MSDYFCLECKERLSNMYGTGHKCKDKMQVHKADNGYKIRCVGGVYTDTKNVVEVVDYLLNKVPLVQTGLEEFSPVDKLMYQILKKQDLI